MYARLLSLAALTAVLGCPKPPAGATTPANEKKGASVLNASEPWPCEAPGIEDRFECLSQQLGEDGINQLPLGMSAKEALALLKQPTTKGPIEEEGATGLFLQEWDYPALGISLEMGASSPTGEQHLNRVSIYAPCTFTTARGVGIGTPVEEAFRLYAKAYDRTLDNSEGFVAGSIYGGVLFDVTDGKISGIFVGQMAE